MEPVRKEETVLASCESQQQPAWSGKGAMVACMIKNSLIECKTYSRRGKIILCVDNLAFYPECVKSQILEEKQ